MKGSFGLQHIIATRGLNIETVVRHSGMLPQKILARENQKLAFVYECSGV